MSTASTRAVPLTSERAEQIARVAHECNRAYCDSIGDHSQKPWADSPDWQKQSAINGVLKTAAGEICCPEDSHIAWMEQKVAEGWVYGHVKDPAANPPTHPCLVPYDQLPETQKVKDHLFQSTVNTLLDFA